jgi:hypothetical protein
MTILWSIGYGTTHAQAWSREDNQLCGSMACTVYTLLCIDINADSSPILNKASHTAILNMIDQNLRMPNWPSYE